MNSELFSRWLQVEAEILYKQNLTPEGFMERVKPLLQALIEKNKSDVLTEKDLQEILIGAKSKKSGRKVPENSFFDIVDLSLYRAN